MCACMQVLRRRSLLLACLILTVAFSAGFINTFLRDAEIRREIARLEARARELEDRKVRTLELLEKIQTDAYAESEARTRLGLKKPGERVLVVAEGGVATDTPRTVAPDRQIWKKWWRYFFGPERP